MIRRDVPPDALIAHAQLMEHSFDELWIVEDLPWAGGIGQMAAILGATESVVVGHGIAPAPFRNPAALAMEWATLAELHPGRIAAGIGHGVQPWMAQIGEAVDSPLSLLSETIDAVRRLMAGESLTVAGRYVTLDSVTLHWPPHQIPPVSAGVTGPNSLRLSGAVADGTILSEGKGPEDVRAAIELINEGRAHAGRTDPHRLTVFAGFYCGDPRLLGPPPTDAEPGGWDVVEREPIACAEQLQLLAAAGADSVVLVPFGDDPAQQLHVAARDVLPHLGRR